MTLENFPGVTLTSVAAPRPPRVTIRESMDRFRTVAFGLELMRRTIRIDRIAQGIDATAWFGIVPECYRDQVTAIVAGALDDHLGLKLTDDRVEMYIDDLNRLLGERLVLVEP